MKPFDRDYVLNKIKEYNRKIRPRKIGDFEIKKLDGLQGIVQGYLYEKKDRINLRIAELIHEYNHIWMRLTPLEIEGAYFAIERAKGKVGVVGLGLGYVVQEMAKKEDVEEIIVYEVSKDVIDLYNCNFKENSKIKVINIDAFKYVVQEMAKKEDVEEIIVYEVSKDVIDLYNCNFKENSKIKVINIDAFKAEAEEFDFFYADIYEYKLTSQIVKDYEAFNELHKIEEYSFFGMEHFLLKIMRHLMNYTK